MIIDYMIRYHIETIYPNLSKNSQHWGLILITWNLAVNKKINELQTVGRTLFNESVC